VCPSCDAGILPTAGDRLLPYLAGAFLVGFALGVLGAAGRRG
jgi:hypothetical protein